MQAGALQASAQTGGCGSGWPAAECAREGCSCKRALCSRVHKKEGVEGGVQVGGLRLSVQREGALASGRSACECTNRRVRKAVDLWPCAQGQGARICHRPWARTERAYLFATVTGRGPGQRATAHNDMPPASCMYCINTQARTRARTCTHTHAHKRTQCATDLLHLLLDSCDLCLQCLHLCTHSLQARVLLLQCPDLQGPQQCSSVAACWRQSTARLNK